MFYFIKRKHLQQLHKFDELLDAYFHAVGDELKPLRKEINLLLPSVSSIIIKAGRYQKINASLAGSVLNDIDPFGNVFNEIYGLSVIPDLRNMVQQTIGLYESSEIKQAWKDRRPKQTQQNDLVVFALKHPVISTMIGTIFALIIWENIKDYF